MYIAQQLCVGGELPHWLSQQPVYCEQLVAKVVYDLLQVPRPQPEASALAAAHTTRALCRRRARAALRLAPRIEQPTTSAAASGRRSRIAIRLGSSTATSSLRTCSSPRPLPTRTSSLPIGASRRAGSRATP